MVGKLWGYFIAVPPPAPSSARWSGRTSASGYEVRPLVEAILRHPLFYEGPRMVIPPVVYCAGMLRALGRTITTDSWSLDRRADRPAAVRAAQRGRLGLHALARHLAVVGPLHGRQLRPAGHGDRPDKTKYPAHETPAQAVAAALAHWGNPHAVRADAREPARVQPPGPAHIKADWEQVTYRILRQNALRALIPTTPEWQTC